MAGFVLPYSGEEVKKALDKAMANKDVSGASVNSLGHLILSFTDGSTLDCGYVGAELTAEAIIQALGFTPADESDIPVIPETLPSPEPIVFSGAVSGSYDGSSRVSVQIPDKLPSPGTLTFSGAVSATYDGSQPTTVHIPEAETSIEPLILEQGTTGVSLADISSAVASGRPVYCASSFRRQIPLSAISSENAEFVWKDCLVIYDGRDWETQYAIYPGMLVTNATTTAVNDDGSRSVNLDVTAKNIVYNHNAGRTVVCQSGQTVLQLSMLNETTQEIAFTAFCQLEDETFGHYVIRNTAAAADTWTGVTLFQGESTRRLAAPANISISGNVLSFDEVENATSYDIYAGETKLGEAKKVDVNKAVGTWALDGDKIIEDYLAPGVPLGFSGLEFTSNGKNYTGNTNLSGDVDVWYYTENVYDVALSASNGWTDESFSTIVVKSEDSDFLTFLQSYACKIAD